MKNVLSLLEAIESDAREEALLNLASIMIDDSDFFWCQLKSHHGKKSAAMAVMCLLQEAIKDGEIIASKFKDADSEESINLRITVIDE